MGRRNLVLTPPRPLSQCGGLLTAALAYRPAFVPACGNPLGGSAVETAYSPQTPVLMPARGGLLPQPLLTGRHFVPACGNPLGGSAVETAYSPQTPLGGDGPALTSVTGSL